MIKLLELFCGAGSFSYSMKKNNLNHEIVGFSDIRENALKVFCEFHDKDIKENMGDVFDLCAKELEVDLLTFGSPCQSFTRAGKSDGASKGGKTKSSLMWEAVRIINECKPKICVWENVPDAISKKHMPNFINYMDEMDDLGYKTYYELLYAPELGSAQKRKRLFAVSIRKDVDDGEFNFIKNKKEPKKISEYLIDKGNSEFLVEEKINKELILDYKEGSYKIKNATLCGYAMAEEGDIVDTAFPSSKTRRGRVQKNHSPTLLRSKSVAVLENGRLRYLTPKEYFLLQEFDIKDFEKIEKLNLSLNKQYDVVGGLINLKHLDVVINSLKKYLI